MTIKHCLFVFHLLLLVFSVYGSPTWAERPNVLLMVADDLGWADVGYHGSPIKTPAIDRLAREGLAMERFYTAPICSPTRAGLLTGRDPIRLGIAYDQIHPWYNAGLAAEELLLPEIFQQAGYQTAMTGKWHLGHSQAQQLPNAQGFEQFFGHLHTNTDFYTHQREGGHDLQRNGVSVQHPGEYLTHLEAKEARHFLNNRDKNRPFFLYVPFTAPHSPMQAPQATIDKYRHLPTQHYRRVYAAMVDELDQAIGSILQNLEVQGLLDNTIVLFISDNGGSNYFGGNNKPLRGQKGQTFEGGIRVPAIIRWPAKLPGGKQLQAVVSCLDVLPTLATAAGVPLPEGPALDGLDRWSVLTGTTPAEQRPPLYFVSEIPVPGLIWSAVIDGDWKLVQITREGQTATTLRHYLFNLREDPNEQHDIAGKQPQRVQQMAELIRQRRAQHPLAGIRGTLVPHPGWLPPKDWAAFATRAEQLQSRWQNELPFSQALIRTIGDRGILVDEATQEKLRQQELNTKRQLGEL